MKTAEISAEFIDREIARSKSCFVVILTKGAADRSDEQLVVTTRRRHLEHLFALREKGKMLLNGPVDDSVLRGIAIFDCDSKEEVARYMTEDPMVSAGFLEFAIHRIRVIPGEGIPDTN